MADRRGPRVTGPSSIVKALRYELTDATEQHQIDATEAALRRLVELLYEVSMQGEEGRFPRFLVHIRVGFEADNSLDMGFDKPLPLSVESLRKLAPAVPPRPFALVVRGRKGRRLEALGFERVESTRMILTEEPSFSRTGTRSGLFLSVSGPGELTVSDLRVGRRAILRLRGLRLYSDVPDVTETATFSQIIGNAMSWATKRKLPFQAEEPQRFRQVVQDALAILLGRAAEAAHGAAFLVLDDELDGRDIDGELALGHRLRPSPRLAHCAWRLLRTPPRSEEQRSRLHREAQAIDDFVELVFRLSQTDGCVVLDQSLQPVGFATEILSHSDSGIAWREVAPRYPLTDLGPFDPRQFGTRHRSAGRVCARLRGTRALVVSQDGDIRAYENLGEGRVGICGPLGLFPRHSPPTRT